MKRFLPAIFILLLGAPHALANAGVLAPTGVPEEGRNDYLSLRKMAVHIAVDEQHASVKVLQLYENLTAQPLEGRYIFRIPEGAAISDFAIWENGARIPGVILERREARQTYDRLTASKLDPGLLERHDDEGDRNKFVVRVYPIPPHGVKRIELSYNQPLEVVSLRSRFSFPLMPDDYVDQRAERFELKFTLLSSAPLDSFEENMTGVKFARGKGDDGLHTIVRTLDIDNYEFTEDVAFTWKLKADDPILDFFAYRDTSRQVADIAPGGGKTYRDDTGYFLARITVGDSVGNRRSGAARPRNIIFALDASHSMRGRKLEGAYNGISDFLERLGPKDSFGLILFNDEVKSYARSPVAASRDMVEGALRFIRESALTGGTDIMGALQSSLEIAGKPAAGGKQLIVLVTDGQPTANVIAYRRLKERWNEINKNGARLFIFGIGDDTNAELLGEMADESDGFFAWAGTTEDLNFKLDTFFDKVGAESIGGVELNFANPSNFTQVYPAEPQKTFAGGAIEFVGKYMEPAQSTTVTAVGKGLRVKKSVNLPGKETSRPWLRRVWAKARVANLLKLIRFEGERAEWIEEIISLAREFKFVTPYTSFLAAPRALLRPRVIKPGDPIISVRADPSIESIVAIFPFGLTKQLKRIEDNPQKGDLWETRFVAPKWMTDGEYHCDLILHDKVGRGYRESKEFVIDSHPPRLKTRVVHGAAPGESVEIRVDADPDTRWIKARLPALPAVDIRWSPEKKMSAGVLSIPADYDPGVYELTISAEDFARNSATRTVPFTVERDSQ